MILGGSAGIMCLSLSTFNKPLLTLVRHLGYSWSPGRTLKEMGTLSARRLTQKASQMARCTALYTTSRPVRATKAMGRQHSSGGSSHCDPVITMLHTDRELMRRKTSLEANSPMSLNKHSLYKKGHLSFYYMYNLNRYVLFKTPTQLIQ